MNQQKDGMTIQALRNWAWWTQKNSVKVKNSAKLDELLKIDIYNIIIDLDTIDTRDGVLSVSNKFCEIFSFLNVHWLWHYTGQHPCNLV